FRMTLENGVRKEAFLYECHPSAFSLSDLQESYGAGDYRVKVFGIKPGTNYRVIHANKKISVGPSREQAKGKLPSAIGTAPVPASTDALTQALAQAIGEPMKLVAQALTQTIQAQKHSRAEALAEVKELAQLAGIGQRAPDPMGQLQTLLGMLATIKSATGSDAESADPEAAPWGMLKEAVRVFGDVLKTSQTARANGPVSVPAPVPSINAIPVPATSPVTTPANASQDDPMKLWLQAQLTLVTLAAANNDDPEKWAVRVYEDAPDDVLAAILAPDWETKLQTLAPGLVPFRDWCAKVREHLQRIVAEDAQSSAGQAG
ncbi:MAG: hypothetical protein NZM12_09645, partial [Steroidobacteraceae bacterium]|nr:hypothetical protein [Steroidobacteraceae bacterium]